jgi:photosystem II stability/assembly factor-like uncharacterized protein
VSSDNGRSWKALRGSSGTAWGGNPFQSASHAFADGARGWFVADTGELLRTSDGGRSWAALPVNFLPAAQVQAPAINIVWVLTRDGRAFASTDGGSTWAAQGLGNQRIASLRFDTALNAWARRGNGPDPFPVGQPVGSFQFSTDAGRSWGTATAPTGTRDLSTARSDAWIAVGAAGAIHRSTDQGKTWTAVASGSTAQWVRVHWIDEQSLLAAGSIDSTGTLLRSADRGLTWQRVRFEPRETPQDIAFADARNGWVVGKAGLVLATRDGGRSWSAQKSGSSGDFEQVSSADAKTAWVSGKGSVLLATGTGGY